MSLENYIRGLRKGREINHLEREAMRDPFLSDVLKGYDSIKGDHEKRIEELQSRVSQRTRPVHHSLRNWSIAASILLVISVGGYFLLNRSSFVSDNYVAEQIEMTPSAEIQISELNKEAELAEKADSNQVSDVASPVSVVGSTLIAENHIQAEMAETSADRMQSQIVVADKKIIEEEIVSASPAKAKVRGVVTDEQGEPLVGASIFLEGTANRTISNLEGYFELPVQGMDTIKVSYLGFEPLTLPIDTNNSMSIAMLEDKRTLNEVVVIGYGTQKKSLSTGAISIVKENKKYKNFKDYQKKEMVYPVNEDGKKTNGEVSLSFSVDENGHVFNIIVKKSLSLSADAEAIRLIQGFPDWKKGDKDVEIKIKF
jgi:hypothetical protein